MKQILKVLTPERQFDALFVIIIKKKERKRKSNSGSLCPVREPNGNIVEWDNDAPLYIPMASSQSDYLVVGAWQLDRQLHDQLSRFKSKQFN